MTELRSSQLRVAIDEATLAVSVEDLDAGHTWKTPGGGLHLKVYDGPGECEQWCRSDNDQDCRCRLIAATTDRAEFHIDFHRVNMQLSVAFCVDENRLEITVPEAGWRLWGEKKEEQMALDVLPLFGAQPAGADGHLVLPHGGGVLRYFDDRLQSRAAAMRDAIEADSRSNHAHERLGAEPDLSAPVMHAGLVYGEQESWQDLIAYPVWGSIVGSAGWCAYVPFQCGDVDTAIVTSANRGPSRLCAAHARFNYRYHSNDTRVAEDRVLRLVFLHGAELNYAALGRVYRRYLVEEAGIPSLRQKCAENEQTDYYVGAHDFLPTLCLKRYALVNNPNPDGKGILDVYMTCDNLIEEIRRLKQAGVEKAEVRITGFNMEGHDGAYPNLFPVEPRIGGEEGFRKLLKVIDDLGYRSLVHINFRCYMRAAPDFRIENVMHHRDGRACFSASIPGGDDYNACPRAVAREFMELNFPRLKELGFTGGMYVDFVLGVIFRCYHPRHPLSRREYMEEVLDYLAKTRDAFGSLRVELMIAPGLGLVNWIGLLSTHERSASILRSSRLRQSGLVDELVPLQAIIYHGITQYLSGFTTMNEPDPWGRILRTISIGARCGEHFRGPQPQWDELHAWEYRVLCQQMRWLQLEWIDNITQHGNVTRTEYSDGTVAWVNHGRDEAQADGVPLPARSFRVVPGSPHHEVICGREDPSLTDREPAPFPDGFLWPDGRAREGMLPQHNAAANPTGKWLLDKIV